MGKLVYKFQDQNRFLEKDLWNVFLRSKKELCKVVIRGYKIMAMFYNHSTFTLGRYK